VPLRVIARYEAIPNTHVTYFSIGDCFAIARNDAMGVMLCPHLLLLIAYYAVYYPVVSFKYLAENYIGYGFFNAYYVFIV
jgi:hypothetical protein